MKKIKINRKNPVEENFLGNNAVYHGFAGMPDFKGRVYNEEQCELEADRLANLGVKIVRTYTKWWAWSREEGWNWENETMQAFYKWCERMLVRNIDIAIHGGWCSPGDINGTSWGGDGPFADGGVDFETATENFAQYVSEMLHQLIEVRGFTNIKYLMLFTESERFAGKADGFNTPFEVWEYISRRIHNRLVKDGRRNLVKLIGPNENARSYGYPKALEYAKKHADDFLDAYGCHIYSRAITDDFSDIHSGNRSVPLTAPGHRVQQYVRLKKGNEYTLSCYVKVKSQNPIAVSGYMIMGFFKKPDQSLPAEKRLFTSGGQDTTRITINSTRLIDPADCCNEWQKYSFSFNPGEDYDCVLGLFSDVKNPGVTVYVDDFSLLENGTEIIKNPSFEEENDDWQGNIMVGYDIYKDWTTWVAQMKSIIGSSDLWYDEYNCMILDKNRPTDPLHGTRLAMGDIAMMNAGVKTSLIWTVFDQQWPNNTTTNADSFVDGNQKNGLMPVLTESLIPYPDYYAFGLVSRYAGGEIGTKVFAEEIGENRLHCTLTESKNGDISVIVVSCRNEDLTVSIDIGDNSGMVFNRRVFNPKTVTPDKTAKLSGIDKEVEVVDNSICDVIPANSVVVYTTRKD